MSGMSSLGDVEFLPEGHRSNALWEAGLASVFSWFLAWLFLDGWIIWVVGLGTTIALIGTAASREPRRLLLTAEDVIQVRRGRSTRIPLEAVHRIALEWVPKRDPEFKLETRDGSSISFRYSAAAHAFARDLGSRLVARRSHIHAKPSAVKALGWPELPGQMD